jgi:glycerol-3-phosphate dehydrogenase
VNHATEFARLPERPCMTTALRIHGFHDRGDEFGSLAVYGSDAPAILDLARREPALGKPLDSALPYSGAQVVWAVREEMARTIEDVLARRCRALFLNAAAARRMAPVVAQLMARELGRDTTWQQKQVEAFDALARNYTLAP